MRNNENDMSKPVDTFDTVFNLVVGAMFFVFAFGLGGMLCYRDYPMRDSTAHYYCGQNGGVATVNARGDAFTCRDGSSYTFHIEKVRDAYE